MFQCSVCQQCFHRMEDYQRHMLKDHVLDGILKKPILKNSCVQKSIRICSTSSEKSQTNVECGTTKKKDEISNNKSCKNQSKINVINFGELKSDHASINEVIDSSSNNNVKEEIMETEYNAGENEEDDDSLEDHLWRFAAVDVKMEDSNDEEYLGEMTDDLRAQKLAAAFNEAQGKSNKQSSPFVYRCNMQHCGSPFTSLETLDYHLSCHSKLGSNYKCPECSATFRQWYRLKSHLWKSHKIDVDMSSCEICDFKACYGFYVAAHCQRMHARDQYFICKVCEEMLHNLSDVENHSKLHQEIFTFECTVCHYVFMDLESLKKHNEIKNTAPHLSQISNEFRCYVKHCGSRFSNTENLNYHQKCHNSEERNYKCPECASTYKHWHQLKPHLWEQHKLDIDMFTCSICDLKTNYAASLASHCQGSHAKSQHFICKICSEVFDHFSLLPDHSKLHEDLKYECSICSYIFNDLESVFKHSGGENIMKITSENKCYMQHCGSKFETEENLNYHLKCHNRDENNYKCPECSITYKQWHQLKQHLWQQHTIDVEMSRCELCNYKACYLFNVAQHCQRMHANQQLFICKICDQVLDHRQLLPDHSKLHDEIRYECNVCHSIFTSLLNVFKHNAKTFSNGIANFGDGNNDSKCNSPYSKKSETDENFDADLYDCEENDDGNSSFKDLEAVYFRCSYQYCGTRFKTEAALKYHENCHNSEFTGYSCPECATEFKNWHHLKQHLWESHKIDLDMLCCNICDYKTPYSTTLSTHCRALHSKEQQFICKFCKEVCEDAPSAEKHFGMHEDLKFECSICGIILVDLEAILKHIDKKKVHKVPRQSLNEFRCFAKHCGCRFSTEERLQYHQQCHNPEERNYKCPECSATFKHWHQLKPHLWEHHRLDIDMSTCSVCAFKTNYAATLSLHCQSLHTKNQQYICKVCEQILENYSLINEHSKLHDDYKYECSICHYIYTDAEGIHKHNGGDIEKTNVDNKCYMPHCGSRFDSEDNLNYHLRCHNRDENNYKCPECSISFKQWHQLKQHLWQQHKVDVEMSRCELCDYKACYIFNVAQHCQRMHANQQLFICKICDQVFDHRQFLTEHSKNHEEIKYECNVCHCIFTTLLNIFKHNMKTSIKGILNSSTEVNDDSVSSKKTELDENDESNIIDANETKSLNNSFIDFENFPFRCSFQYCGSRFKSDENLIYHKKCHNAEGNGYTCPECSNDFKYWHHLKPHLWEIHRLDLDMCSCNVCDYKTYYAATLATHCRASHSKDQRFSCKTCSELCDDYVIVEKHSASHQEFKFECKVCGIIFTDLECVSKHIDIKKSTRQVRQNSNEFRCYTKHCGCRFSTEDRLHYHQKCHNLEDRNYKCPECSSLFKHWHQLKPHLWEHHKLDIDMCTCSICGLKTNYAATLASHCQGSHFKNQQFVCKFCDNVFENFPLISDHTKVHEEQKFECTICHYVFTDLDSIEKHNGGDLEKLSNDFKCYMQHCGSRFENEEKLNYHLRCHNRDENNYKCPECSVTFKQWHLLKYHLWQQHKIDMEMCRCELCNYKACYIYNVAQHCQRVHANQQLFICKICDQVFDNRHFLLEHSKLHEEIRYECNVCHSIFVNLTSAFRHNAKTAAINGLMNIKIEDDSEKMDTSNDGEHMIDTDPTTEGENLNRYLLEAGNSTFKCNYQHCGSTFKSDETLKFHQSCHNPEAGGYLCPECYTIFKYWHHLKPHLWEQHKIDIDMCSCKICDYKTAYSTAMITHCRSSHTKDQHFICKICNEPCDDSIAVEKHVSAHEEQKYECVVCLSIFSDEEAVLKHNNVRKNLRLSLQNTNEYQCFMKHCGSRFSTPEKLMYHKNCHNLQEGSNYKCPECSKGFRFWHLLKPHLWEDHKIDIDLCSCSVCGFKTNYAATLAQHCQGTHIRNQCFICLECEQLFEQCSSLEEHCKSHEEIKVRCSVCQYVFTEVECIIKHNGSGQLIKIDDDFRCYIQHCGSRFKTEENLLYHISCHDREGGNYKCPECSTNFKQWHLLKTHIWQQHQIDVEMFKCELCFFKACYSFNVAQHCQRVHAGQQLFICKDCGHVFEDPNLIPQHSNSHDKMKYECNVCHYLLTDLKSLFKHNGVEITRIKTEVEDEMNDDSIINEDFTKNEDNFIEENEAQEFPCSFQDCTFTFKTKDTLKYHHDSHNINGSNFSCIECCNFFETWLQLKLHLSEEHKFDVDLLNCNLCLYKTYSSSDLILHCIGIHIKEQKFVCNSCDNILESSDISEHSTNHNEFKYNCFVCKTVFVDLKNITKHNVLRSTSRQFPAIDFKCYTKHCGTRFSSEEKLIYHQKCHNSQDKNYSCPECNDPFRYWHQLKIHLWEHHKIDMDLVPCNLCDHKTNYQSYLASHCQIAHAKDQRFTCKLCNETLKDTLVLHNHSQLHKEQKYECSGCRYIFTTVSHVYKHNAGIYQIKDASEFKCHALHCGTRFKNEDNLKYHESCHDKKLGSYKCPECSFPFRQWHILKGHLWEDHKIDIEMFKCELCDYKACYLYNVSAHCLKKHTEKQLFVCKICEKEPENVEIIPEHAKIHKEQKFECTICHQLFSDLRSTFKHHGTTYTVKRTAPENDPSQSNPPKKPRRTADEKLLNESNISTTKKSIKVENDVAESGRILRPRRSFSETLEMRGKSTRLWYWYSYNFIYKCNAQHCGTRFKTEENLKYHQTCHNSEIKSYECPECKTPFRQWHILKQHLWDQHRKDVDMFACEICNFKSCYSAGVSSHCQMAHGKDQHFICRNCNQTFDNGNSLQEHSLIHDTTALQYECKVCHHLFMDVESVVKHNSVKEGISQSYRRLKEFVYKCTARYCGCCFKTEENLQYHLRCHNLKEKNYICPECSHVFSFWHQLKVHLWRIHKVDVEMFSCEKCSFKACYKAIVSQHCKHYHAKSQQILCKICNIILDEINTFQLHVQQHERHKYECCVCHQFFTDIENVLKHFEGELENDESTDDTDTPRTKKTLKRLRTPSCDYKENKGSCGLTYRSLKGYNFKCNVRHCGCCFKSEENLTYHLKCHNLKGKNYVCPECSNKFGFWHLLKFHLWKQHKIDMDMFSCELCNFKACYNATVVTHCRNLHIKHQKFSCSECNEIFECVDLLDTHNHSNNTPKYECNVCHQIFTNQESIIKHNGRDITNQGESNEDISPNKIDFTLLKKNINKDRSCVNSYRRFKEYSYRCPVQYCGCCFKTENNLKYHLKCHNVNEKNYKCPECSTVFQHWHILKHHLWKKYAIDLNMFSCEICGFRALYKARLSSHCQALHCNEQRFICKMCGYILDKINLVEEHAKLHKNIEFECDVCHYILSDVTSVFQHNKQIQSSETYKCSFYGCKYASKSPQKIRKHEVKHTKEIPLGYNQCNQKMQIEMPKNCLHPHKKFSCFYCSFSSNFHLSYEKHLQLNHPYIKNSFVCKMCSFSSKTKEKFELHNFYHKKGILFTRSLFKLQNKFKISSFPCTFCDFVAAKWSTLKLHKIRHHRDGNILKCPYCPYLTGFKTNFSRHLQNEHQKTGLFSCSDCIYTTFSYKLLIQHTANHKSSDWKCTNIFRHRSSVKNFLAKPNLSDNSKPISSAFYNLTCSLSPSTALKYSEDFEYSQDSEDEKNKNNNLEKKYTKSKKIPRVSDHAASIFIKSEVPDNI